MPYADGKLTDEDKKKIESWLNENAETPACPVCGSNLWNMGEYLLRGEAYTTGGFLVGGPSYPMAFIVCDNCGHVRQFMAKKIGLTFAGAENASS